ncbi:hypothetical protein Mgra_00007070, partial [Meloidogyne graminicola]
LIGYFYLNYCSSSFITVHLKLENIYNFGSLHPANVINSIWDNNEQQLKEFASGNKRMKYIIIPRPQLIDLSLYVFNYQQAISSSYKTLDIDVNSDVEELLKKFLTQ